MSWGAPDDGDPDNPIRVACRVADELGFGVYASAGNYGPERATITLPATDPQVIAIGAATFYPTDVWTYSSRGPTKEGLVKPDLIFYGVRILTASCKSDDAFVIKSGTSFACPFLNGMIACGQEAVWRMFGVRVITQEGGWQYAKSIAKMEIPGVPLTVKPTGAPADKDNDYGYGLPFGTLWAQALTPGVGIESIMAGITPLLGIAMMGMIMAPMTKVLR